MLPKMKAHLSGIAGTEKEKPSKVSFHHKQQTSQGLRLKVFPSILHRWNSFSWNDWGGTLGPSAYQALSYHWPMSQWWGTEEEHSVSQTMQLFSRPAPLVTDQPVQGQSCYAMYCILPGTWTPACLPLVAPGSKSRKCLKASWDVGGSHDVEARMSLALWSGWASGYRCCCEIACATHWQKNGFKTFSWDRCLYYTRPWGCFP